MRKLLLGALMLLSVACAKREYRVSDYGLMPNSDQNASEVMAEIVDRIAKSGGPATIIFDQGVYNFYPEQATQREYYISNHDQPNPRSVGVALDNVESITIEGNGAELLMHGRMLPMSIFGCGRVMLRNFTIDFPQPHIAQSRVLDIDHEAGETVLEIAPWVDYEIRDNKFINKGHGWENTISSCIAFDGKTRRILYRTSDIPYNDPKTEHIVDHTIRVKWSHPALKIGSVLAMRSYYRPSPGIFIGDSKNITITNVTVHYAEGMGLLAQMSENINLDGFNVNLRGDNDPRYFTTQADATHFSGCRGDIISINGDYEAMMDDAINVHGTYLRVMKREDSTKLVANYMHPQAWGFRWGEVGDTVQFVYPKTMELAEGINVVKSIKALDKPTPHGAKSFEIEFMSALPEQIEEGYGIENLTWTPSVTFAHNTVANNRARGALFSTPKPTLVEENLFDHVSGSCILLCGDCNGWYETGACRDVVIRNNVFINPLTSLFQFTNGAISIYPEIPNLRDQRKYFHGGKTDAILIEDNLFQVFDKPLVYAKSVDGITIRRNTVVTNNDYKPFHFINAPFYFERVENWKIENNKFDFPFDPEQDVVVL